jgi:hypothetical protein
VLKIPAKITKKGDQQALATHITHTKNGLAHRFLLISIAFKRFSDEKN